MAKSRLQYICQNCGAVASRWQGRCDECGAWNTLIEEGLRSIVSGKQRRQRPPGPIPVSKATGGTWPGIDLSNSAAIQEMEDMEYIERMKTFR